MAAPKMTKEQRVIYNAVRTWATNLGSTEWHLCNDPQPSLLPPKPVNDPANWDMILNNMLRDIASTGGPELAEHFQATAERNRKAAWKAHEKGTQKCLECAAQQTDAITEAINIFGSNP
jgi:hypothetical protein